MPFTATADTAVGEEVAPEVPATEVAPVETPATPAPSTTSDDRYPEFIKLLSDLQARVDARDTTERQAAEAKEKAEQTRKIGALLKEGDLEKIKSVLAEVDNKYSAKLQE